MVISETLALGGFLITQPLGEVSWGFHVMLEHVGLSINGGTPKSSILIVFSIINRPFWGSSIYGNPHVIYQYTQQNVSEYCGWKNSAPPKGWLRALLYINNGMFTTVLNWCFGFRWPIHSMLKEPEHVFMRETRCHQQLPMTGDWTPTHKHGDDWGMVQMALGD